MLRSADAIALRWLFVLIVLSLAGCGPRPDARPSFSVSDALGGIPAKGFERAIEPRRFRFPRDHGAHPKFRNEWWYLTGNLDDDRGHHFGYQLTFFRIGLSPESPKRRSRWATNEFWMAHAALTNADKRKHYFSERFSRGSPGLAGVTTEPFRVWIDDWRLSGSEDGFPWTIRVKDDEFSLHLELVAQRSPVLQGERGLSRKGPDPGDASYYYSITRLGTTGTLSVDNHLHNVNGLSWLDREWSTSALSTDQVGWDWFSLQFEDGTDLMYYQLRNRQGKSDPYSAGLIVTREGATQRLSRDELRLTPINWWQSSDGARYPIEWRIQCLACNESWLVRALVNDQYMDASVKYWEGAVEALSEDAGELVGRGYLELTGY